MVFRKAFFLFIVACALCTPKAFAQGGVKIGDDGPPPARRAVDAKQAHASPSPANFAPRESLAAAQKQVTNLWALVTAHDDSMAKLRMADSLRQLSQYHSAVLVGSVILVLWLILIVFYIIWAIRRYVYNYGLSTKEWKILYPEVYETVFDRIKQILFRNFFKLKDYSEIKNDLVNERITRRADRGEQQDTSSKQAVGVLEEPDKNPYQGDSFGLPPGTIRGILALTALVLFLVIEGVNLFAFDNLENRFSQLISVLQMVIAFYFGSRAVEVLQAKKQPQASTPPEKSPAPGEQPSSSTSAVPARPLDTPPPVVEVVPPYTATPPAENPTMHEGFSVPRLIQVGEVMRGVIIPVADRPALEKQPLPMRVLALTASFETGLGFPECFGSVTGNFDDQGLSFGVLQSNINQGSLQPLWNEMHDKHDDVLKSIFGDLYSRFMKMLESSKGDQFKWALEIQHTENVNGKVIWRIDTAWQSCLHKLGVSKEMIEIQVRNAGHRFEIAQLNCKTFGLSSDRAVALMFDINVQNGRVDVGGAATRIRQDYMTIAASLAGKALEEQKMEIVARRRSEVAGERWRNDVLTRKLTIARGIGRVHGRDYDIEKDFNLSSLPKSGGVMA